jgi:hypothetical protein
MLVYDKRNERIDAGFPDPGPWVRYELVVRSEMGPTLKDAYDPTPMFFHFASPDVLERPEDVASWAPHAEGFALEKLPTTTPMQKMYRLLDSSADVARLVKLAHEAGPGSVRMLLARIERMATVTGEPLGAFTAPTGPAGSPPTERVPSAVLEAATTVQ